MLYVREFIDGRRLTIVEVDKLPAQVVDPDTVTIIEANLLQAFRVISEYRHGCVNSIPFIDGAIRLSKDAANT